MSAIDFHRNMLRDKVRNQAFYRALRQVVRPGESTVADVGAGTGFLAFLARQLGATECHLYEYGEVLGLAQQLAQRNGIDGLYYYPAHSTAVEDALPVDVVVSETLGNYAYEENIIETLEDAKRFLKPGGVMMPQRIEQFVAPVVTPRFHRELTAWGDIGYGLDFSLAQRMSLNNIYVRSFKRKDLWPAADSAQRWDHVDFRRRNASVRKGTAQWTAPAERTAYGFAVWWNCELVPGVELTTSPLVKPTHWEQLYFPVLEPLTLARGDTLSVTLRSDTRPKVGVNLRWTVRHTDRRGRTVARQSLDMSKGQL